MNIPAFVQTLFDGWKIPGRSCQKAGSSTRSLLQTLLLTLPLASASASLFVNDGFTDGGRTNGSDTSDVPWYTIGTPTLAVVSDTGIGSGNACRITPTGGFQGSVGNFPAAVSLADGDSITLTFQWRYTGTSNLNLANRLRFGIYNSGGTLTSTDNTSSIRSNDQGYAGTTNPGAASATGSAIFREAADTGDILTGATFLQIGSAGGSVNAGTTAHAAELTLTRTGNSLAIASRIDGQPQATATDTSPLTYTFDEVAISLSGSSVSSPLLIDNVQIENYRVAVNDPYTDGGRTAGADPNDVAWFAVGLHTPAVVDDTAGIGSGNALKQTSTNTFQGLISSFQRFTLADGDKLTLFCHWRFSGTTGLNQSKKLRFGLFDSKGTLVTADNSINSDTDVGYFTATNPGAVDAAGTFLLREGGDAGFMSGADTVGIGTAGNSINAGTTAHSAELAISRSGTSLQFATRIDGSAVSVSGADATPVTYSFDEAGLLLASGTIPSPLLLDNVQVEYSPVQVAPPPPPTGAVTAQITASRTTGPAPLAVMFDAGGTTTTVAGTDVFRQLTYSFNFGDERGQNWTLTSKPKNTQVGGPLAAHVFDVAGTYVVSVRAQDSAGNFSDATVSITVTNPDTVYSGTNTICVSTSGNFTGAPAGAVQQTTLPSAYAGKRVLLRRGETFGSINPRNVDAGFQVGGFGAGNKPVVTGVFTGMVAGVAQWTNDFTIMDLNIGSNGVAVDATTSKFLLYRCDINTPVAWSQVNIGTAVGYYYENTPEPARSAIYWPKEVFIIENDIQGVVNSTNNPGYPMFGHFTHSAVIGNTINKATEHSFRIWAAHKLLIAHNRIGGEHYASPPPGIRAAIKLHSAGTQTYTSTVGSSLHLASRYVVIVDNIIGSTTFQGSWTMGVGPQNADPGTIEKIEDIILERNTFVRGPYTSQDFHMLGGRVTTRGNVVSGGGALLYDMVTASEFGGDPGNYPWCGPYFGQAF